MRRSRRRLRHATSGAVVTPKPKWSSCRDDLNDPKQTCSTSSCTSKTSSPMCSAKYREFQDGHYSRKPHQVFRIPHRISGNLARPLGSSRKCTFEPGRVSGDIRCALPDRLQLGIH